MPGFAAIRHLAIRFQSLLRHHNGTKLDRWLDDAKECGIPAVVNFAKTLMIDIQAVRNAVIERWSNGQTEGQINRLKTLKRAMFGRTNTELLRARLLPLDEIADTGAIIGAAQRALGAIWRPGFHYKKAGVMLLDLVKADHVQSGLFDRPDDARSQARLRALDKLNRRFGRDTVSYAAAGVRRGWSMQRGSLSPRYTTNWDELLAVGDTPRHPGRC